MPSEDKIKLFEEVTNYIVSCESPFEISDKEGCRICAGELACDFFNLVLDYYTEKESKK